jgi:hypothetical protein
MCKECNSMKAWDNLPNAAHIDRVLAHSQSNLDKWSAAWDAAWDAARAAIRAAIRDAAWDAARAADRDAAWDAAGDAARGAAWDAARDAARAAAWNACAALVAWDAAWNACAALVAWDEAGDLMDKPASFVRFLAEEGVHAAVLLLPAVVAMEEKTSERLG